MKKIRNENAKKPYYYNLYRYDEITNKILQEILLAKSGKDDKKHKISKRLRSYSVGSGKYRKGYFDINFGFDIETTTVIKGGTAYGIMYIWQCSINKNVIIGRSWCDFIALIDRIKAMLKPSKNQRLLCLIHNLNFELSFMRSWLNITDSFLKEQRAPLYVEHDNFVIFQDSYALTNLSLKKVAETYCNTQKCVNDLQYDLYRHYETPLTDVELGYCANDVLILDEYLDYFYKTYMTVNFKPLTVTGILNKEVQDLFKLTSDTYKRFIELAHPKDYDTYIWFMSAVYRGGYVHGNELYIDDLFTIEDKIAGCDITSSYPASMLYERYGYRFRLKKIETLEEIEREIENDMAVVFEITFYNIKRKTLHSIESKSKCIYLDPHSGIDNGRVANSKEMRVALTEQDYLTYREFYQWDSEKIHKVYVSQKEYLPKYIIEPLIKYYELKNDLKQQHKDETIEYKTAKSKVNSFYGLCCKKLPTQRVVLDNDGWHIEQGTKYDKQKENGLLPFFGIYISSYSRRHLLSVVYNFESAGYPVLYCDTDSIKISGYDEDAQAIIDEYNNNIKKQTELAIKRVGCSDLINGLGEYDMEYGPGTKHGEVSHFKMLGAKRYMISCVTGYNNQTVAGMPKNELFNNYDVDTAYEMFTDELEIKDSKLRAVYTDTPFELEMTDYLGCTRTVSEKSCVALVNTDFTMSIDNSWYEDILNLKWAERYVYDREVRKIGNNNT